MSVQTTKPAYWALATAEDCNKDFSCNAGSLMDQWSESLRTWHAGSDSLRKLFKEFRNSFINEDFETCYIEEAVESPDSQTAFLVTCFAHECRIQLGLIPHGTCLRGQIQSSYRHKEKWDPIRQFEFSNDGCCYASKDLLQDVSLKKPEDHEKLLAYLVFPAC